MKYFLAIIIAFCFLFLAPQEAMALHFTDEPDHLIIPSLAISLPITTASIIDDTWDVSTTGVSFGQSSALPGHMGNTILFAHALPQFFAPLPELKKGDYIHVFTKNDWFVYQATDTTIVDPEDVAILQPTRDRELTLYTCVGINYEKRFVVKARLVSYPADSVDAIASR